MYVRLTGPSKYVCMSEAFWACMYVCPRQLSVYVCMSQATEHVCMYVSNIHTYTLRFLCKIKPSACMDLFKNPQPVMKMKHTYMLKSLRNSNITVTHQEALNYVCMFENPVFYRDKWNIHTLSFTRHFLLMICFFESVCFKTSCFVVLFAPGT